MNNNMFEDAYFGKPYRTRDGRKAVYLGDNTCWIEGGETEIGYSRNGLFVDIQEHSIDIVSEWKEEINEEELDKLAIDNSYDLLPEEGDIDYVALVCNAFKVGFRFGNRNKKCK